MSHALASRGLERFDEIARAQVAGERDPGVVALVAHGDDVRVVGRGALSIWGAPVRRDTLFRISSITKPITGAATLALIEEGLFTLDAGLVSTADDLLAFSQMLLRLGAPVLSSGAVADMTRDHLTVAQATDAVGFLDGQSWGYCQGIVTSGPHAGAYGWSGGLGCSWMVDPVADLVVIVLTQRLFGCRAGRSCTSTCRPRRTRRSRPFDWRYG